MRPAGGKGGRDREGDKLEGGETEGGRWGSFKREEGGQQEKLEEGKEREGTKLACREAGEWTRDSANLNFRQLQASKLNLSQPSGAVVPA